MHQFSIMFHGNMSPGKLLI